MIVRECVFKSVSGDGQEPSDLSEPQIFNYEQTLCTQMAFKGFLEIYTEFVLFRMPQCDSLDQVPVSVFLKRCRIISLH